MDESTSKTELRIYRASEGNSALQLDIDEICSGVLTILDGKYRHSFRIDHQAIKCLSVIMKRWSSDESGVSE